MSSHLALRSAPGILLLLAASMALAQDAQKDKKDAKGNIPDYYPLHIGNAWHYKVTANGQTSKVVTRVAKVETVDGKMYARLESSASKDNEHLLQNDMGVFRTRFNGAELTPPFQLIPYPAKLGAKWKGTFVVKGDEARHAYEGEIGSAEETIEVPAGKFQTIRVRIKLLEKGQLVDATYWFAKDVGFVKETLDVAGVVSTLELEKFDRKSAAKS